MKNWRKHLLGLLECNARRFVVVNIILFNFPKYHKRVSRFYDQHLYPWIHRKDASVTYRTRMKMLHLASSLPREQGESEQRQANE